MTDDPIMVSLPVDQLTDTQLHRYLVSRLVRQDAVLDRVENFMANLTESVAALQGAVDNVAVRINANNTRLTDALAEAVAVAERATLESQEDQAALDSALADAQAAADAITNEVNELNGIGANPDQPVEDVPVEELPPAPSEEQTETTP